MFGHSLSALRNSHVFILRNWGLTAQSLFFITFLDNILEHIQRYKLGLNHWQERMIIYTLTLYRFLKSDKRQVSPNNFNFDTPSSRKINEEL